MDIKRWPTFLALMFTLSFRVFALAQESNDKPDVPRAEPQAPTGTIVVGEVVEGVRGPNRKLVDGKEVIEIPNATGNPVYVFADPGQAGPLHFGTSSKVLIGVAMAEVPDSLRAHLSLAEGTGILVGAVVPNGPAAKAGLQQYDILLKAGGQDLKQAKDLLALIEASESKPISIQFQRRGELKTVEVTPIKREELTLTASSIQMQGGQDAPLVFNLTNGQPLNLTNAKVNFTSSTVPPAPLDSLTKSIQALTEQVERLQKSIDQLEKKSVAPEAAPPSEKQGATEE